MLFVFLTVTIKKSHEKRKKEMENRKTHLYLMKSVHGKI